MTTPPVRDYIEEHTLPLYLCHFWRREAVGLTPPGIVENIMSQRNLWAYRPSGTPPSPAGRIVFAIDEILRGYNDELFPAPLR